MVCGSRHNNTENACDQELLKLSEWTPENFAKKYFSNDKMLDLISSKLRSRLMNMTTEKSVLQAILDAASSTLGGDAVEDSYLWSGGSAEKAPGRQQHPFTTAQ
jgi:hypothetical protein